MRSRKPSQPGLPGSYEETLKVQIQRKVEKGLNLMHECKLPPIFTISKNVGATDRIFFASLLTKSLHSFGVFCSSGKVLLKAAVSFFLVLKNYAESRRWFRPKRRRISPLFLNLASETLVKIPKKLNDTFGFSLFMEALRQNTLFHVMPVLKQHAHLTTKYVFCLLRMKK